MSRTLRQEKWIQILPGNVYFRGNCTLLISSLLFSPSRFVSENSEFFFSETNYVGIVFTVILLLLIKRTTLFRIAEIVTSSPVGMQLTTLSSRGGFYQRNVTWYPNQQQIGQQVFCFKAVDSAG